MDKRDENKKEDFSKHKDDSGSIVITLKMVGQFFNGVWKIALLIVMFMSMSALFDIADMTYFAITGGGNPTANNNTSETSLTSTDWYKQRLYGKVDDVNKLFNLDYKNYIVYFRQDGCSYCAEAEAEIVKWLDAGNDSVVQIVFVDMATNPQLWSEDENYVPVADPNNFFVPGTPTFLHKKTDGTFETGVGPQYLIDIFNSY